MSQTPPSNAKPKNKYIPDIVWEDEDNLEGEASVEPRQAAQFEDDQEASLESNNDGSDFAALMQSEDIATESYRVGDKVTGIIAILGQGSQDVIVDLGSKQTAVIALADLDSSAEKEWKVGDEINAVVSEIKSGEIILSTHLARKLQAFDDLRQAYQDKVPVKGKVTGENKGGFDVMVAGKKAFCPVSQIDDHFVEDKSKYLGKEYSFVITKLTSPHDIAVSRKPLLEKIKADKLTILKKQFAQNPNFSLTGKITKIEKFGAFADIGGIEGLIHISEMGFGRLDHPEQIISVGDNVRVTVKDITTALGKTRIALTMKHMEDDPWSKVEQNQPLELEGGISTELKVGGFVTGKVTSIKHFGAFVQITPGLEGLVHVSELSWTKKVNHPNEVVAVGDMVKVQILSIDKDTRQIALSIRNNESDPWDLFTSETKVGEEMTAQAIKLKSFGAIMQLREGITGLLPLSAIKNKFGESYRKKAAPPHSLEIVIKAIDEDAKKVLLGLPNTEDDVDNLEYKEYLATEGASDKTSPNKGQGKQKPASGSFGELLAEKLGKA